MQTLGVFSRQGLSDENLFASLSEGRLGEDWACSPMVNANRSAQRVADSYQFSVASVILQHHHRIQARGSPRR